MKRQIAVILALVAASISIISCSNAANEPKDAVQAALEAYKYVPDTTIKTPLFDPYELGEEPVAGYCRLCRQRESAAQQTDIIQIQFTGIACSFSKPSD